MVGMITSVEAPQLAGKLDDLSPLESIQLLLSGKSGESLEALVEFMVLTKMFDHTRVTWGQFLVKYMDFVMTTLTGRTSLHVTFHYHNDLLAAAKREVRAKRPQMACVSYATWCEHFLNDMLYGVLTRGGMSPSAVRVIMRRLTPEDKVAVIGDLTKCRMDTVLTRDLKRVNRVRNDYLHYKIHTVPEMNRMTKRAADAVLKAEQLVNGLLDYERKALLGDFNYKKFLRRLLGSAKHLAEAMDEANTILENRGSKYRFFLEASGKRGAGS